MFPIISLFFFFFANYFRVEISPISINYPSVRVERKSLKKREKREREREKKEEEKEKESALKRFMEAINEEER